MSNMAIRVEKICKKYRLGTIGTGTISHDLNLLYHKIRGKENPYSKVDSVTSNKNKLEITALEDISFDVKSGETFGIIGKNGAGKSTLLKIISKITTPTSGKIFIKGNIASLLEIGTGFHPEMTGRENIYMNGAILGMKKNDIKSKFDEIVDFSGIAQFIDTPVKRYSSGMYLKLAFSVAAHLEPDILIIDEVLAVGDAEFQKKCLGKIKNIGGEGRTVIFVSHNMAAVQSIATRSILLEAGKIIYNGPTNEAVTLYMKNGHLVSNYKNKLSKKFIYKNLEIKAIGIKAHNKKYEEPISRDNKICFCIEYINNNNIDEYYHITYRIKGEDGQYVFTASTIDSIKSSFDQGRNILEMYIPEYFFNYETFYLDILILKNKKEIIFMENDILSFTVVSEQKNLGDWIGKTPGSLYPKFEWNNKQISE